MPAQITGSIRIAVGQFNPVVGDIAGNLALARRARAEAAAENADLLFLTELFLSGYPPEDLVLRPAFLAACREALEQIAADTADGGPAVLLGVPTADAEGIHNSVALLDGGVVEAVRHKVELPNYGVFDEVRVFRPGPLPAPVTFRGLKLGVPVCEDIWLPNVTRALADAGAELFLVPNGSPYWRGKTAERTAVAAVRVNETGVPLIYANQVGGQDELVFDGGSFGLQGDRSLAFQLPTFREALRVVEWRKEAEGWRCASGAEFADLPGEEEANWRACVLALADYVDKNGFPGVVLGLSGGIDSAVAAAMAVDALGPERVRCVMLPYRFTSPESIADAAECAAALGIRHDVVPIAGPVEGFEAALQQLFAGLPRDLTEENLQARARGTLLMAISNKTGLMVVTTGNKSEMSVGYATLYGDMNGGYNPLKDLYKTEVYRLARWRNASRPPELLGPSGRVIPERIITRAPTAELRENQTDQDSLPPYEMLDAILEGLVEEEAGVAEIAARGFDVAVVRRIERMLYLAEYKRRQAAPGAKISRRNFGRDRRYPITNRYRDPS